MAGMYRVTWTAEAKSRVDEIIAYLRRNWSEKEVNDFLDLLLHFENTISRFPKSYKESAKFENCRLGLIHRHVSAVYKISRREITVLTVFDNRRDVQS